MRKYVCRPIVLTLTAGLCAGIAQAQDADPGPDLAASGSVNVPIPAGQMVDPAGFNDAADKDPASAIARARASWPFQRITREEAEARMASDAAVTEMLARLDARGIALQPPERPNYYYYRGRPLAMDLDVTRVAIMLADNVPDAAMKQVATAAASQAGLTPAADGHAQSGRWVLVSLHRPLAGYEDADARLNAFANTPGVVIASPVFHSPLIEGGYLTVTPDILAQVKPELRAKALDTVAAKAPNLAVFNPALGTMPGAVQLRSHAKNGFDVLAEANRLAQDPAFSWAEPDMRGTVQLDFVPNDTAYWDQWQHDNNGTNGGVADQDMDSDLAWDYTRGSSAIDVLILDEGTQPDHADINWQTGRDFTTGVVAGVGNGAPSSPCDNHGTSVAGIVAQRGNNSLLGSGTAPSCNVLCAKVADHTDTTLPCSGTSWTLQYSYIVNAIAWGVTNGADVSNSSYGLGGTSAALETEFADSATVNGVIHMAATGNSGASSIAYPASIAYVYGVGNLTNTGDRNSSSQYGTGTDFTAPGTNCRTTDREGTDGYASGDEVYFSGTSCASPNAAGVAAMFRSAYPWATRSQTYTGVADGCRDRGAAGYDTEYGYGFVNSYYSIVDVNPSNDRCVSAIAIPDGTHTYSYANLNTTWATDGWNEPQATCESGAAGEGASVWWKWTAPNTGTIAVNTNGSDYDTVLSIWDGCGTVNASNVFVSPTLLACDDDGGTGTQSQILAFPVQVGDTYYFKASAYGDTNPGGLLDFALTLTATPPDNDSCASRTVIPGNAYGTYNPPLLDTDLATTASCEHDETCGSSSGNSNSVWYEFTPFEDGEVTVHTQGSSYDTVLSIFRVSSCPFIINNICLDSSSVACNDDYNSTFQSYIGNFQVDQGVTYFIKVCDYGTEGGGALDFNFTFDPPATPANDNCSSATPVPGGAPGGNFQDEVRAHSAGTGLCDGNEDCELNNAGSGHSVWYTFTPQCNGLLGISTQGSLYDTVLSVWSNCSVLQLPTFQCSRTTLIACDDDSGAGTTSLINNLSVTAGNDYLIKVAAYGTGNADRLVFSTQFVCVESGCDSIDFNGDGLFPDTADIDDFLSVFSGGPCSTGTCGDIDFNNDGLFPDTADIDSLLSVFSGGPCT
ncbi:MAG: S8 family serine peptidase [Phycisphaerales bacterium]